MSQERYFLEMWYRGSEAEAFRFNTSNDPAQETHPHITFVLPFEVPDNSEDTVKKRIVDYCAGKRPIQFELVGAGNFNGEVDYIPVEGDELKEFDTGLEKELQDLVNFDERLALTKTLHLTIKTDIGLFPRTESTMLRLTCVRDKKIWFSYDFVTGEVLNREESLDETRWQRTKELYQSSC